VKPSSHSVKIRLDFDANIVDGDFVGVWPSIADEGQSVIGRRGHQIEGSKATGGVVFAFEVEFDKPDL